MLSQQRTLYSAVLKDSGEVSGIAGQSGHVIRMGAVEGTEQHAHAPAPLCTRAWYLRTKKDREAVTIRYDTGTLVSLASILEEGCCVGHFAHVCSAGDRHSIHAVGSAILAGDKSKKRREKRSLRSLPEPKGQEER